MSEQAKHKLARILRERDLLFSSLARSSVPVFF